MVDTAGRKSLVRENCQYVLSQLIEWDGYEAGQTPLLYVFRDLKVHYVQKQQHGFYL